MYVPGKICKPEQPLIDIGTGYYAENVSLVLPLCLKMNTYHNFNILDN